MIFSGVDHQTVEIRFGPVRQKQTTAGDSVDVWVQVYIKINSHTGSWQTVDPCLTVAEIEELIGWFDLLSVGKEPPYQEMRFTEPSLSFSNLGAQNETEKRIRIKFNGECRPQSAIADKEYFMDFIADRVELSNISSELRQELHTCISDATEGNDYFHYNS